MALFNFKEKPRFLGTVATGTVGIFFLGNNFMKRASTGATCRWMCCMDFAPALTDRY